MYDEQRPKRLEKWGLRATLLYLIVLVGGLPVAAYFGAIELKPLGLNEIGDFLAGAFGPLAIFWIVLGFLQQGEELRNSVNALKLQADELKSSVEQQKAMVGITEQQLKLDIQVREEQTKVSISKDLPFVQLRGGGSISSGGKRQYRYHLKNIGAACTEGLIVLADNDELEVPRNGIPYLDQNSEFEISLNNKDGRQLDVSKTYVLEVTTFNIRNQKRSQRFEIGPGQPKLVWCDPEVQ
ncbi:hypothetical protein O2N63_04455 [Aliiroseovarius sp. KMU-50]|uniref:Uncharacterized protein n=1 Tax=Aliiroseovarius salicola TaxID=3009082 RepID=A0ABT4W0N1_9RHOB|nr:hypothetical protein [Aliiroseovarius sp. KMU-50]MDA5093333.1 hypothetical protein [Aliiroseovarius sp. KMU-50]